MTLTDWLAIYGAVASTLGGVWVIYQHWTRGPRLVVSCSSDMQVVSNGRLGNEVYIRIGVRNRGDAPTTITHVGYAIFPSRWRLVRRKPTKRAVLIPGSMGESLPHVLEVGSEFATYAKQTPEIEALSRENYVFVEVMHSFSDKPVRNRLDPIEVRPATEPAGVVQ